MQTIETAELKNLLDRNEDLLLINALTPDMFEREHIPGSQNIPSDDPDPIGSVERLAGARDRQIVVYCSKPSCQASPNLARKLEAAGFQNVIHYPGGMDEWTAAGLDVEHGAAAQAT